MGKKKNGLTLIEILVAMIILLIGVVSVLSLFPSAMLSTKRSLNDTISARIAESVCNALTIAMRTSTPCNIKDKKPGQATVVHDGLTGADSSYTFALPLPVDPAPAKPRLFSHPAANPLNADSASPEPTGAFQLGSSDFIKKVIDNIKSSGDPTELYDQFAFTFTVSRVDDDRLATETGDSFKPMPLYQFGVKIYRVPKTSSSSSPSSTAKLPEKAEKVFVFRISGG
ncbi:MAG: prepilin-type N-terminal cleavage/methylation domain-containing protein [Candidatus Brocadiia bacterium]